LFLADPLDLAKAYNDYGLVVHALELWEAPGFGEVAAERTMAVLKDTQCPSVPDDLLVSYCTLGDL
jgi:hypothetical protein